MQWISPYDVQSSEHDRPTDPVRLKRLDNWQPELLEPIELNVRPNGAKVRMAGKHRCLKAIEKIEGGEFASDYKLPWIAHYFDTPDQESAYVQALEMARRKAVWSANDFFVERLISDPAAIDMDRRVRENGFRIALSRTAESRRDLKGVATLERIDRQPGLLDLTLSFLSKTWPDMPTSNETVVIEGIARFIYCHQGAKAWEFERAVERLGGLENLHLVKRNAKLADATAKGGAARFVFGMRFVYNLPVRKGGVNLVAEREWTNKGKK